MEQNSIINFANEFINNLYSDTSNITYQYNDICANNIASQLIDSSSNRLIYSSLYMLRPNMFLPINTNYTSEDTSFNETPISYSPNSPNYLRSADYNYLTNDSSYITITSINNEYYNNLNYPRAISIRDLLRTLFANYNEEDENNTFVESFINSTFENKAKFKKVISDSELEKLQPQKFNKINETETNIECPILCYNFEENEEIIKLPCNHNYNSDAILKWLSQESNTCPVCRHEFDYKEINIDNKRQDREELSTETSSIYNLFSNEELLMQEMLLNSYSNNN
jgi:hypothetical protein